MIRRVVNDGVGFFGLLVVWMDMSFMQGLEDYDSA